MPRERFPVPRYCPGCGKWCPMEQTSEPQFLYADPDEGFEGVLTRLPSLRGQCGHCGWAGSIDSEDQEEIRQRAEKAGG